MLTSSDKSNYKLLASSGAIPADILERALKQAEAGRQTFWKAISDAPGVGEAALYEIFSKQTGIPVVPLKKLTIESRALDKVPVKIAWYYKFFPYKLEEGKVWVAVSQIPDISILDEIRFGIGIDVMISFAPEKEIIEMLNKHYGLGADTVNKIISQNPQSMMSSQASTSTHAVEDIEKKDENASVAQLVNQIILEAYKKRASDIHLEPFRGKVRLRYRIDGVLHEAPIHSEMIKFFSSILSRIKIMANLNVVEKRMPQDGKMRVKVQDQDLDLRVSSVPTTHGESMVIRLLPGKSAWTLNSLGLEASNLEKMKLLLQKPNGILFVTGPTGSGKSTTLYGCLSSLNSEERKIVTIEDPVEYELEGISQIQVASDIGLGFSQGLRSVLRHDPDVMMVGEVRDLETADIAIRAALTGHLILSTLHTNDAASGITRLTDIGVEKYLIASSVLAFVAQRLVRTICPHCKEPRKDLDPAVLEQIMMSLELSTPDAIKTFRGRGCDHCNATGFSGRYAIHEILVMTDEIRSLIMQSAPAGEVKRQAMKKGMQTLRQDGFRKVLQGLTTPEEILRVSPADHEEKTVMPAEPGEMNMMSLAVKGEAGPFEAPSSTTDSALPQNKRKFKRVPTRLRVSYKIIEHHAQHPQLAAMRDALADKDWPGNAQNISAGGVLYSSENMTLRADDVGETAEITVNSAIESGTILELQIYLPGDQEPVRCVGRVLRVSRSVKTEDEGSKFVFHIAVLFLVINSMDRLKIEKYCDLVKPGS